MGLMLAGTGPLEASLISGVMTPCASAAGQRPVASITWNKSHKSCNMPPGSARSSFTDQLSAPVDVLEFMRFNQTTCRPALLGSAASSPLPHLVRDPSNSPRHGSEKISFRGAPRCLYVQLYTMQLRQRTADFDCAVCVLLILFCLWNFR